MFRETVIGPTAHCINEHWPRSSTTENTGTNVTWDNYDVRIEPEETLVKLATRRVLRSFPLKWGSEQRRRCIRRVLVHAPVCTFVFVLVWFVWLLFGPVADPQHAASVGLRHESEGRRQQIERAMRAATTETCFRLDGSNDSVHPEYATGYATEYATEYTTEYTTEYATEYAIWVRGSGVVWRPKVVSTDTPRVGIRVNTSRCPGGRAVLRVHERVRVSGTTASDDAVALVLEGTVAYCVQRAIAEELTGPYTGTCDARG
jgi:hypothetical protein